MKLPSSAAPEFELGHRVPLSLTNLQLQPWEGDDGAKKKDRLERKLQTLVCSGKVRLDDARRAMYFNRQAALPKYMPKP